MHAVKNAIWNALEHTKRRHCEAFMEGISIPHEFKEEVEDVYGESEFIFRPYEQLPGKDLPF